jgi:hypothetical protein
VLTLNQLNHNYIEEYKMKNKYKILLSAGLFLCFISSTYADSPFVGTFEGKMGFDDSGMMLSLTCKSESECQLKSVFTSNGNTPHEYSEKLDSIEPVEHINEAEEALKYAKEHKSEKITNKEDKAIFENLQPLLNSDINIEKCIDLNLGGKGYTLVCSTKKPAWEKPSLLYMGTLLASCGEIFCRFVIYPLFKK